MRATLLGELDDVNEAEREWREDIQDVWRDLGDLGSNLLTREFGLALEKQLGQRL